MEALTRTPHQLVVKEVEDMTPEEAADIWRHIEPYYVGACARAGGSRAGMEWNAVVRKMSLIQEKAEEVKG